MNDTLVQSELHLDLSPGDHETYVISKKGALTFKPETTQGEWENITRQLADLFAHTGTSHVRIGFLLGDALNYGEKNFSEECAQAIDATREQMRLTVKTIENYAWIAGRVPPQNRHELLSFAHHKVVAKLPENKQGELLDLAQREALTVVELGKKVKEIVPPRPRKVSKKKKAQTEDVISMEQAAEASRVLASYAKAFIGPKAAKLTAEQKKFFAETARDCFAFCRRFVRKH